MSEAEPHTIDPTGAPSPFEKQNATLSKGSDQSAAETPLATTAFHSRAPSRCVTRPSSRAAAVASFIRSNGKTRPPETLWVFSKQTRRVRG